ncbi:hypothetical protein GLOTRDRAFT_140216 [Gloeophyllum trabeum ATCC 11539]|uniref:Phosphatidylserine decarboxylase proenzyme 2 n=1 Tax=Gloeophyllum trabeum (strain ATCC 11539 / FP-39264 / Madison 617) TaxID=670483 RepID=S7PYZ8_GLOTA|nr:uncharacterized protein GLOTRDRAFT_140216 [Gloeophyllum trabeum ATCC 11539]EPQ52482.1 hypothetical protein GLOTRDRAFT_140216 [Gloeophyllum trabeum ATCC 11539]
MAPAPKKALKLRRALKSAASAARLPTRVTAGRSVNAFAPIPGELPVVFLRVQVLGCKDLLAKDKSGNSDPFVVVSLLSTKHQTPVVKRSTSPIYAEKEATFDFPIYLSLAEKLGVVELVVWDKDMLKKDYLGEVSLPLEDWFKGGRALGFDDPNNKPFTAPVVSTRTTTKARGTIEIKLGFVQPPNTESLLDFDEIYQDLVKRSRPSLMSAPPTEGIGTVRSNQGGPLFEDDGFSSDEGEGPTDEEDEEPASPRFTEIYAGPSTPLVDEPHSVSLPLSPTTPTAPDRSPTAEKTPVAPKPSSQVFKVPKVLRRPTMSPTPSYDSSSVPTPTALSLDGRTRSSPVQDMRGRSVSAGPPSTPRTEKKGPKFRKSWGGKKGAYNFSAANDIVGIVMLEIHGAEDLPRLKNMTRTGWDMDPFVVISFGKKVFRTRVIRHSRNPIWDEKLLFHVRRYETSFKVQLTVLDWDKLSSNDHVGDASFNISELLADVPAKDPATGLYTDDTNGDTPMKEFKLPLSTAKEMPWEGRHNPTITFKAKYQPYDALRQRFWRQYLKQYDTDDTGALSHVEITSMLDSLGSTLSAETVSSFFTRHGKKPHEDELTIAETVQCLEEELCRPASEKKRITSDSDVLSTDTSAPVTPAVAGDNAPGTALDMSKMNFSGPPMAPPQEAYSQPEEEPIKKPSLPPAYPTERTQQPLQDLAVGLPGHPARVVPPSYPGPVHSNSSSSISDTEDYSGSASTSPSDQSPSAGSLERVINVKNCPLCHRPRMNSKAEMDIVTHLAVCASQDWARVDRIVVGNFVTASQAQRKWYTKIISKVSSGNYKLGANSANIIIQNRMTGQLEEEKMQVYVRLGIRLLYKGMKGRMEGARARKLLKSLSIKQGIKYDSPESARDILPFIEFHNLNVDEIRDPISSFKTFNEFFYRKLKPEARPVESPNDPGRLVSAADCRLMTFETVNEATKLWIKGREFTVARLLGDAYKDQAERYNGGALAIFRLAPQDYHRFHSPVDGTIGPMTYIAGEYYTVNPQAIRTALDVYGENARKIVPIDSPQFGRVMAVCVGAMMVGTIRTTVQEGEQVKRGQEFGYFAFGGSTIVMLFERGVVEWDEDLLINGRACLETLVRVGMGIGRSLRSPSPLANGRA